MTQVTSRLTTEAMIAAITAAHVPAARDNPMVYSVWEDGEITIEKGGDIFGQRNCHLIAYGRSDFAWPADLFPVQNYAKDHGRVFVADRDSADAFRRLIIGE